jgi:hypothetical protein
VGRADWLLVGGAEVVTVVEGIARPQLAGQPYVTLLAMALMPALLWRRSHPLTTCLVGFGVAGLLSAIQLVTRTEDLGPSSMMVVLLLLYSVVRWGSGPEIAVGMPWVAAVVALGLYAAAATLPDIIGGTLLLLLFVALAAVFRARADLWQRRQREIRNQERLALARELHDTVAHHVSAIAVQAQAGGVVARTQPAQAAAVLAAIEAEATAHSRGDAGHGAGDPPGTAGTPTPHSPGSPTSRPWRARTRPPPSTSRSPAPSPACPGPWTPRSIGSRRRRSPMPSAMLVTRPRSASPYAEWATSSGCA